MKGDTAHWLEGPEYAVLKHRLEDAHAAVEATLIEASVFGRIWLRMILWSGTPNARAASTKSIYLSDSTVERMMRARYIQLVRPIIIMITITLPLN